MSTITTKMHVAAGLMALMLASTALPVVAGPSGAQTAVGAPATTSAQAAFNRDMDVMRAQMVQLQGARDPATRTKLLDEHMQTMQRTLRMMMGDKGMAAGTGGMGPGTMQGGGMAKSGGMMANGQMMQMMMGEMMQHQQAMQGMGCSK